MSKVQKVPTRIFRSGDGRSTVLQEQPEGTVLLAFRRPIQSEQVENGCLVQQNVVSRKGTKRVVTIVLDETSAKATYLLLKERYEDRARINYLLSLYSRLFPALESRSFLSRLFC